MKIRAVCLIVSIPFALFSQKNAQKKTDFGEGSITVGVYGHSATDKTMRDDQNELPLAYRGQVVRYSIKGNSIFRSNPENNFQREEMKDSSSQMKISMHVSMFSPNYLIKYDSSLLYLFSYENNRLTRIIPYNLDTFTYDYFYRHVFEDSMHIKVLPLKDTEKILINNIPCYRGRAVEIKTGYPVSFYYTKQTMKVSSPINAYFNYKFPFNIIRVKFHIDWSERSVLTAGGGYLIFQLEDYSEKPVDPKLFTLPVGIPVTNNIPLLDVIKTNANTN